MQHLQDFETGRIITEHKERYIVRTDKGEYEAEITGNMRFAARSREDFPAVGDWVALQVYDGNSAIIHQIYPRSSLIKRQAVGSSGEVQVIAANIDYAFLVQAVDRDFNINRLERYLTICHSAGVSPIVVLTKTDLSEPAVIEEMVNRIQSRLKNIPVLTVSNLSKEGLQNMENTIEAGKTYCMLGSSGVGKSSLINNLSGGEKMETGAISESTSKGRHVTSHRELIVLESGGILIDNPGMREVGITDSTGGLENTFDFITGLTGQCKFSDCTHTSETGCAVLEAVENGKVARESYENFLKMEREKSHFESSLAERRKKDKQFGKMFKNYKKEMKGRKF